MRAYARKHLPDSEDPDDLVQEAFTVLSGKRLDDVENVAGLLMTILERLVCNQLRRSYRIRNVPLETLAEGDLFLAPDVADFHETQELNAAVRESVRTASPRDQRLFESLSAGRKPSEIAAENSGRLGLTSGRVRSALYDAKARLRKRLQMRGFLVDASLLWMHRVRLKTREAAGHFMACVGTDPNMLVQASAIAVLVAPGMIGLIDSALGSTGLPMRPLASIPGPLANSSAETQSQGLGLAPVSGIAAQDPRSADLSRAAEQTVPRQQGDRVEYPSTATQLQPIPYIPEEMSADTPGSGGAELNHHEYRGDGAPPVQDQTFGLIQDPSEIPLPQCWGLPPCEEIPNQIDPPPSNELDSPDPASTGP